MTRQTIEAVAGVLRQAHAEADLDREDGYVRHLTLDDLTYDLADLFHRNYQGFDSTAFFVLAGLRDVPVPVPKCRECHRFNAGSNGLCVRCEGSRRERTHA